MVLFESNMLVVVVSERKRKKIKEEKKRNLFRFSLRIYSKGDDCENKITRHFFLTVLSCLLTRFVQCLIFLSISKIGYFNYGVLLLQ